MRLIRAVTHVRLCDANHAKVAALDALAAEYLRLCQAYTTFFCTEAEPDQYAAPCFGSTLSQRWQRVAIQQAAGVAQSWRRRRETAYQDYLDLLLAYREHQEYQEAQVRQQAHDGTVWGHADQGAADRLDWEPIWTEWNPPVLQRTVIQANANVALLQPSKDSCFDYWLRVSTLEKRQPILLPVTLADYHRQALAGKTVNASVTLARKPDGWWLTLSYDEEVPVTTPQDAPIVGVDIGIVHFITASDGTQYGTFHGKLAACHQRDREKRRRKAKLRACLRKKGVEKLPSTRNQKLARHVRQEINRAVNQFYADHPNVQVAYEQLSVAGMRFRARRMNAYLYASNLAHLPNQLAWGAVKRGIRAQRVKSAYSSQECARCHYAAPGNRPSQQTFCCGACGWSVHADLNAARNLAARFADQELAACANRVAVKALLAQRHGAWRALHLSDNEDGWS
jgi:hypothetical protein